jgi:hypothetical protein
MQKTRGEIFMKKFFTGLAMGMILALMLTGLVACGGESERTTPLITDERETPPRQPKPPVSMVGEWRWEDDTSFLYSFYADGTGFRGFEWLGMAPFQWEMDGDVLDIRTTAILEEWTFAVVEEEGVFFLVISSLQEPGLVLAYMFTEYVEDVALEDYSILLGAWAWVDDLGNVHPWDYVFFSDATGIRGTTENFDFFYWEADYATGELLIYIPSIFEEWDIVLTQDRFVASNAEQLPGVRLIYNRVN